MKRWHISRRAGSIALTAGLVALITVVAVAGQAGRTRAVEGKGGHPSPVGAWLGVVDAPPGGTANRLLVTFNADGTFLVSVSPRLSFPGADPAARPYAATGHGVWQMVGERRVDIVFVILFFDEQGMYAAMQEVYSQLTLAPDGNSTTSVASVRVTLADGTVTLNVEGVPGPRLTRIRP